MWQFWRTFAADCPKRTPPSAGTRYKRRTATTYYTCVSSKQAIGRLPSQTRCHDRLHARGHRLGEIAAGFVLLIEETNKGDSWSKEAGARHDRRSEKPGTVSSLTRDKTRPVRYGLRRVSRTMHER